MDTLITHFIDGTFYQSQPADGQVQGLFNRDALAKEKDLLDPSTAQKFARVIIADEDDVNLAIGVANRAQPAWANKSTEQRAEILKKFLALLVESHEKIARAIVADQGKSLENAKYEILHSVDIIRFAISSTPLLKGEYHQNNEREIDNLSITKPIGVVAGMTLSNFPAMSALWMFPVALICGNTFILKPSQKTPSVSLFIASLLQQAGLPNGVFNVLHGDEEATEMLIASPDVQAIAFSGATEMVKHVQGRATLFGKRVQTFGRCLNQMVVSPDANLELTSEALIQAAYISGGERTTAASVAILVGDIADTLIPLLQQKIISYCVDNAYPTTEMPPMATLEYLDELKKYIDNSILDGAELLIDGRKFKHPEKPFGFWLAPTLFDHVTPEMELYYREYFGPILSCVRVKTMEEAIALVNNNELTNGASCFTSNQSTAQQFSDEVELGMIGINAPVQEPMAWHGSCGWKRGLFSSIQAYGTESIRFYTHHKSVVQFRPADVADGASFITPNPANKDIHVVNHNPNSSEDATN